MKIYDYNNLTEEELDVICSRALQDDTSVEDAVKAIIQRVKTEGDAALYDYNLRFDGAGCPLIITAGELEKIAATASPDLQRAIEHAAANIRKFHAAQVIKEPVCETIPGVKCWRENRPIESVGLYIPGGTAVLPSTFLMLAIPAQLAGCRELVICTPPQQDGSVNAAVAYCAVLLGIDKIYLTGGAQAIAAMAYGTATIPKTDKIFGPGNRYVTTAKRLLQWIVPIDMPAGPSEVLVVADDTAIPSFVAADLLAQAEHGTDSQAILVTTSSKILNDVQLELKRQIQALPRKDIAEKALDNSFSVLTPTLADAMAFSNRYAPEHLILAVETPEELTPSILNAGSVFLGNFTPESAGDYASGTNHTLPTSGFAKAYSGVSTDSFLKKITFQQITREGLRNLEETVTTLAVAEGLDAHRNSITVRTRS